MLQNVYSQKVTKADSCPITKAASVKDYIYFVKWRLGKLSEDHSNFESRGAEKELGLTIEAIKLVDHKFN